MASMVPQVDRSNFTEVMTQADRSLPAYWKLRELRDVSEFDFATFTKSVLNPAIERCIKEPANLSTNLQLPSKRAADDTVPSQRTTRSRTRQKINDSTPETEPIAELTASVRRDAVIKAAIDGPFILDTMADTAKLRRLLVFDWYAFASAQKSFVLFMSLESNLFKNHFELIRTNDTRHMIQHILHPGEHVSRTYLCLEAKFLAPPSALSFRNLILESNVTSTQEHPTADGHTSFIVDLTGMPVGNPSRTLCIGITDVIVGKNVQGYAPLPHRKNIHFRNYIEKVGKTNGRQMVAVQQLLHEVVGDSKQTNEVINAYKTIESKRLKKELATAKALNADLRNQLNYLQNESSGKDKLIAMVEQKVGEALRLSLNNFVYLNDPILPTDEFFKLIDYAEQVIPNTFQNMLSYVSGSGRYQKKNVARARAFFFLMAAFRQGRRKLLTRWATLTVLANMSEGSGGRTTRYLANLGFTLSQSGAYRKVKELEQFRDDANNVIGNEQAVIVGYDNFQQIRSKKYSNEGSNSSSIVGTCSYAVKKKSPKVSASFPFPVEEGMPKTINPADQAIPAPPGMHPFESIMNENDAVLFDYILALDKGLDEPSFPTAEPTVEFSFETMRQTNGMRVKKYMEML